ncbi:hypothetical protein [Spongiactinospora rosea]|uniref:hypothetical protein n=1 Tax=Spongiactinospora rosea TaxID=2248750 RepID=UPI0011C05643|nr:hypothetical protein [Spongiactinospora rosea]
MEENTPPPDPAVSGSPEFTRNGLNATRADDYPCDGIATPATAPKSEPAYERGHLFVWDVEAGASGASGVTDSRYGHARQEMLRALDTYPCGRGRVRHAWVPAYGGIYDYGATLVTAYRTERVSCLVRGDAWDRAASYDLDDSARQRGSDTALPYGTGRSVAPGRGQPDLRRPACLRLPLAKAGHNR